MTNIQFDFGMVGLGVMGRNLLLNMADHGFSVIGFDKDIQKGAALESSATPNTVVKGVSTLAEMVQQLKRPRKLMMLVPAGKPVDDVITDLLPLLEDGDIVIDGGNSHYTDTLRRLNGLKGNGIHFMGVGISGGEQGARTGPSIMPGGDPDAYREVKSILEAVAAKVGGSPCVAHLGKGAAGHYVKMVHNGIEYAIMQLISESYDLMRRGLGLDNDDLHKIYRQWNEGELQSFLIEITADIFLQKDDKSENRLVDMILDKAGSKGTGKWTSQDAMDLPISVPVIDMAVALRDLSTYKDERIQAAALYRTGHAHIDVPQEVFIQQLQDALFFATIICYAQGLAMLQKASTELAMEIPLPEVVRVWRGGCIIRSSLLETFLKAYQANPSLQNLLLDKDIAQLLLAKRQHMRNIIMHAAQTGYAIVGLMASLGYFDAYRSEHLPTNLIQAQRDFFGAHTYQRIDMPGTFHTDWNHRG